MIVHLISDRIGHFATAHLVGSAWKCWDDGFDNKHPVLFTAIKDFDCSQLGNVTTCYFNYMMELLIESKSRDFKLIGNQKVKKGTAMKVQPGKMQVWFNSVKKVPEQADA